MHPRAAIVRDYPTGMADDHCCLACPRHMSDHLDGNWLARIADYIETICRCSHDVPMVLRSHRTDSSEDRPHLHVCAGRSARAATSCAWFSVYTARNPHLLVFHSEFRISVGRHKPLRTESLLQSPLFRLSPTRVDPFRTAHHTACAHCTASCDRRCLNRSTVPELSHQVL